MLFEMSDLVFEKETEAVNQADFTYRAVVKKRFGKINAADFLKYARRFANICHADFEGSLLELKRNLGVPVGVFAMLAASQGEYEGARGEIVDHNRLDDKDFAAIFETSETFQLRINLSKKKNKYDYRFANVTWTRKRPQTIFFHGEGAELKALLEKKMFFAAGFAPNLEFDVKEGIDAAYKEAEGKHSPFKPLELIEIAKLLFVKHS